MHLCSILQMNWPSLFRQWRFCSTASIYSSVYVDNGYGMLCSCRPADQPSRVRWQRTLPLRGGTHLGLVRHLEVFVCGVFITVNLHVSHVAFFRRGGLVHLHKSMVHRSPLNFAAKNNDANDNNNEYSDAADSQAQSASGTYRD